MREAVGSPSSPAGRPQPTIVGPSESKVVGLTDTRQPIHVAPVRQPDLVGPSTILVQAAPRPAWDERGWSPRTDKAGTTFEGLYQVRDRRTGELLRFAGRIAKGRSGTTAYIYDPPQQIRRHPKGPCFMLMGDRWFRVNWHRAAKDPENALLYVEKVLDEAINS